jgi:hypothetical protein
MAFLNGPKAHPSSCIVGTMYFLGVKQSLVSSTEVTNGFELYLPFPSVPAMAFHGVTFTLLLYILKSYNFPCCIKLSVSDRSMKETHYIDKRQSTEKRKCMSTVYVMVCLWLTARLLKFSSLPQKLSLYTGGFNSIILETVRKILLFSLTTWPCCVAHVYSASFRDC